LAHGLSLPSHLDRRQAPAGMTGMLQKDACSPVQMAGAARVARYAARRRRRAWQACCRAYMLRLSKDRERSARWQRAAQSLLAKADVGAVSRQLELALIYDGKLDVRTMA